ncbi:MAG TPA: hypothetical protein VN905_03945 [Candidatus Binatia bacterium]|nr:hypothetical protein [Candidatus Binatia bacterium]
MSDPDGEPSGPENRTNVLAAGAVAILVCLALIGLFVWQPWSPGTPPAHPASSDAR